MGNTYSYSHDSLRVSKVQPIGVESQPVDDLSTLLGGLSVKSEELLENIKVGDGIEKNLLNKFKEQILYPGISNIVNKIIQDRVSEGLREGIVIKIEEYNSSDIARFMEISQIGNLGIRELEDGFKNLTRPTNEEAAHIYDILFFNNEQVISDIVNILKTSRNNSVLLELYGDDVILNEQLFNNDIIPRFLSDLRSIENDILNEKKEPGSKLDLENVLISRETLVSNMQILGFDIPGLYTLYKFVNLSDYPKLVDPGTPTPPTEMLKYINSEIRPSEIKSLAFKNIKLNKKPVRTLLAAIVNEAYATKFKYIFDLNRKSPRPVAQSDEILNNMAIANRSFKERQLVDLLVEYMTKSSDIELKRRIAFKFIKVFKLGDIEKRKNLRRLLLNGRENFAGLQDREYRSVMNQRVTAKDIIKILRVVDPLPQKATPVPKSKERLKNDRLELLKIRQDRRKLETRKKEKDENSMEIDSEGEENKKDSENKKEIRGEIFENEKLFSENMFEGDFYLKEKQIPKTNTKSITFDPKVFQLIIDNFKVLNEDQDRIELKLKKLLRREITEYYKKTGKLEGLEALKNTKDSDPLISKLDDQKEIVLKILQELKRIKPDISRRRYNKKYEYDYD